MTVGARNIWVALLAVTVAGIGIVESRSASAFSSEEPIPVSLVNGAGEVGEPVAKRLRTILRNQDELDYVEERELLEAGAAHGVTVETLRKGSQRRSHAGDFRETMRQANVESILVLDVFSGKAQIVAIGPRGREISDKRREMTGDNLKTRDAAALLKATFGDVVPEWKAWKRGEKSPTAQKEQADDASKSGSGKEGARASSSSDVGIGSTKVSTLQPGVEIWMGGVAGRHTLQVTTPNAAPNQGYGIDQANPFLGAKFELSAVLGRFASHDAGFGLDVFGIYAPFNTALDRRNQDGGGGGGGGNVTQYSSSISQLGVDLKYINQLTGRLRINAGTGFEVMSLRIEKNEKYTGNRYAQFRFTTGATYRLFSVLDVHAGGGLAPVLNADMSGGAFGDAAFAPAVLGEGELRLLPFDPVIISLGYQLYYYDLRFRNPNIIRYEARVTDTYQYGTLKLSYKF